MPVIMKISEFFLLSMSLGVSFFAFVANSELTGRGFLRLIHNVCLVSLGLGFICNLYMSPLMGAKSIFYLTSFLFLLLSSLFHKDEKSLTMWGVYFLQTLSLLVLLYIFSQSSSVGVFPYLFILSSTFFLGIITYSMLLGHWYLVVPKLSERPLKIALIITWLIMLLKVVMTTIAIIKDGSFFLEGSQLGAGYMFNWIVLIMRLTWGYLIIGIMSYFTWKLVKMRSIQSATGILYVMTFFVFIGELISTFFFYKYGMYL